MKKKKVLIAGVFALSSVALCSFAISSNSKPMIAYAEEEEPAVVEEAVEETTNKFKDIWETYLLPAILSVNVSSFCSAIVAIIFAVLNRRDKKLNTEKIKEILSAVNVVTSTIIEYSIALAERNERVKELLVALKESKDVAEKQVQLFQEQKVSYDKLKNAVLGLINVETELAKTSPELVKGGLAKEIVELKNEIIALTK